MPDHDASIQRADQAHRLRQLMTGPAPSSPAASRRAHLLAVASGKGGVGKTFLAVNASIALAARGHRVVLFDVDMGLANADILLGVEPRATWADLLAGRRTLDDVLVDAPGGIGFVPGTSGVDRLANLSEFERHKLLAALRRLESECDVLVVDCGAGISHNVVTFAAAADTILVVATPEPTSITDAYAMIKTFARDAAGRSDAHPAPTLGVVVNLADSRSEARETYDRLAGVAAQFLHIPVLDFGYILRDDHVPAAVRGCRPLILSHPRCAASACVAAAAARISRELGKPDAAPGLFYRVMNLFL